MKKLFIALLSAALAIGPVQPADAAKPKLTITHAEFVPVSLQKSWTITFTIRPASKAKGMNCSLWSLYSRSFRGQGIGPSFFNFNSSGKASFKMTTKEIQKFSSRGPDSKQPYAMWFAGICAGVEFTDEVIYLID